MTFDWRQLNGITSKRLRCLGWAAALAGIGLILPGCSPPQESQVKQCQLVAKERAKGKQFVTEADLGELTEACMSERGFTLNRHGGECDHDMKSENVARCYYPATFLGRMSHEIAQHF